MRKEIKFSWFYLEVMLMAAILGKDRFGFMSQTDLHKLLRLFCEQMVTPMSPAMYRKDLGSFQ